MISVCEHEFCFLSRHLVEIVVGLCSAAMTSRMPGRRHRRTAFARSKPFQRVQRFESVPKPQTLSIVPAQLYFICIAKRVIVQQGLPPVGPMTAQAFAQVCGAGCGDT
jgi:hypothetical protein